MISDISSGRFLIRNNFRGLNLENSGGTEWQI